MQTEPQSCPCQSTLPLNECCGPLLYNQKTANSPTALMRSRYSAFALHNTEYLLKTHFPEFRSADEAQQLAKTFEQCEWIGLKIVAPLRPVTPHQNEVEFVAFFRDGDGRLGQVHERSRFVQVKGEWFYTEGEILPAIKLPRNNPCICGSGKKFKKCCDRASLTTA